MKPSRWHRTPGQSAWIMGVLNCTPDSFSDGGRFVRQDIDVDSAAAHGRQLAADGAAIIDVGGESTRPGSKPVTLDEELARVIPVIRSLATNGLTVSIDTTKAEVMRQAIDAGAALVNDVTALTGDERSLEVVAGSGVDVCLMHMQGIPETMQQKPGYKNVVDEVAHYLDGRVEACLRAGIKESSILIDPGIGFGKRLEDNLALIVALERFRQCYRLPVLMGVSRKSFLGLITGSDVSDREMETAAAVAVSVMQSCDVVRVHDVAAQRRVVAVASALRDAQLKLS